MQESAGASGIHHETRGDFDIVAVAFTPQSNFIGALDSALQSDLVEILRAGILCFADKVYVDIGPIPMRIGNSVVRTRCNQQLIFAVGAGGCAPAELVVLESEAAFESAV